MWNVENYIWAIPRQIVLNITLSDFFHFLLISRVQASVEKAAKRTWKSDFPAKLHPPKVAKFASLPLDMSIFGAS